MTKTTRKITSYQEKQYIGELKFWKRLLETYPQGILSIVSDTYDYFRVLTDVVPHPQIKKMILDRHNEGVKTGVFSKLVLRPDSGDPLRIVCGYSVMKTGSTFDDVVRTIKFPPETQHGTWHYTKEVVETVDGRYVRVKDCEELTESEVKGSIELLAETFGYTTNSKGFKELHPAIGLIYGDSINLERQKSILERMKNNGWASSNIVFGVGSYHYQYQTRDAFGMAVKATYGETKVEGAHGSVIQKHNIFKDPKSDTGKLKKSHKGLLCITNEDELLQECTWEQEKTGRLETVFENGFLIKDVTFDEVRKNAGY